MASTEGITACHEKRNYNVGQQCWDTYQNTSEQSLPPLPPSQAKLSFEDQTHFYTRKTIYQHFSTLCWGGGWGGGGLRSNCALKNSYSSTNLFFGDILDGFYKCPNYL